MGSWRGVAGWTGRRRRSMLGAMTPGGDPLVTPPVVFVPLLAFYLGAMLLLRLTGR